MKNHMKRIKKALKNGRRVHFSVAVIDAWSSTAMWEDGYKAVEDAITAAKAKRQDQHVMDGPYVSCSVHYQDTDGPDTLHCSPSMFEDVPKAFFEVQEYVEALKEDHDDRNRSKGNVPS